MDTSKEDIKGFQHKFYRNGRVVSMLIDVETCVYCNALVIADGRYERLFPLYHLINLGSQMKKAGLRFRGATSGSGVIICLKCENQGAKRFRCTLCNQDKSTSKIKESFGDPQEFLCTDCYKSVSAETWGNEVARLEEEHQHDFR